MPPKPAPERKWDFDRVFRLLLTVATCVALFALVRYLADVLIPFAIAVLLAYLLNPIVNALESRFNRRTPAVLVTVIGCGVVLFSLGLVVFQIGSKEVASLRELAGEFMRAPTKADVRGVRKAFEEKLAGEENPVLRSLYLAVRDELTSSPSSGWKFREDLNDTIVRLKEAPPEEDPTDRLERVERLETLREVQAQLFPGDPDALALRAELQRLMAEEQDPRDRNLLADAMRQLHYEDTSEYSVTGLIERGVRAVAPTLMNVFSGTLSFILGLTGMVVVLLYLIFLLIDYGIYEGMWKAFLPPKHRDDILGFLYEFTLAMSRYFRGQFLIAMIMGVLYAIGFSLLGLRMAVLLGLGIGLLNMVPYLQVVGMVPALLLGFVKSLEAGQPLWLTPLLVLGLFGVVQLVQDGFLVPKILGKSMGLRPVVIMLGLFIWGKLLGFLGLLLAIPLTCLGLAYYRRFVLGDRTARAVEPEGA
ncbi:MAG: AI-2E family transporter [Phycisphaerales bacterium]|nr:AI-2E family transporter [Phycisphaerales bacterium]